jgi:hypothetical protein
MIFSNEEKPKKKKKGGFAWCHCWSYLRGFDAVNLNLYE